MKKYIALFLVLLFVCISAMPVAAAAEAMDTRTLASLNKPGVVLLQTVWTADVIFNEYQFVDSFFDDLTVVVGEMVESGQIPSTEEAVMSALVQLMIVNMADYIFYTGNTDQTEASTAAVGTGFIVTPDGYLVTNAHVVETNEEELYYNMAVTTLSEYVGQVLDSFVTQLRSGGYQMSSEEITGLQEALFSVTAQSIEINNLQTTYHCYLGNVTPGSDVSNKGYVLDLRKMGEPIPGKDVAILKLDKTNLPTVSLGDDTLLRTGDKVYAMGYPAVATLNDALNVAQAAQEPTMTQGIISAKKQMSGGWSILQTDAAIHGGNSGGPLFNEQGEVIAINTFTMLDPSTGAQAAGMNFAVPISVVKQFLNETNVTPAESNFTKQYKEATSLFGEQKYREALEILRGLNETNPGYPVISELLAEARTLADSEAPASTDSAADPSTPVTTPNDAPVSVNMNGGEGADLTLILIIVGGVLVLLVLILIIVMLKKRKPAAANAPAAYAPPAASLNREPQTPAYSQPRQEEQTVHAEPALQNSPPVSDSIGQSKTKQVFCGECGAPLSPGMKFCIGCGAAVKIHEQV